MCLHNNPHLSSPSAHTLFGSVSSEEVKEGEGKEKLHSAQLSTKDAGTGSLKSKPAPKKKKKAVVREEQRPGDLVRALEEDWLLKYPSIMQEPPVAASLTHGELFHVAP